MNNSKEYNELYKRLVKIIYIEDSVRKIDKDLKDNLISEEKALQQLKGIENKGISSLPPIENEDWKELIRVIDESEKRLKKSIRLQLYIALAELPFFIFIFLLSLYFNLFHESTISVIVILMPILGVITMHTFFILRIYQQGATAIERFSEKRVGILFLRIAANPMNVNIEADKLINAGTLMFLGHHVKPAEPLNPQDLPNKMEK
ncbi:MAG: hypothetical protein WCP85_09450 [Mariniphaga sp.]